MNADTSSNFPVHFLTKAEREGCRRVTSPARGQVFTGSDGHREHPQRDHRREVERHDACGGHGVLRPLEQYCVAGVWQSMLPCRRWAAESRALVGGGGTGANAEGLPDHDGVHVSRHLLDRVAHHL